MLKFSTDELPPHERFAHWQEVRARSIYGVTIDLEKEHRPHFKGTFSAMAVGDATLVEIHASGYRVSRSWADIANAPSDSLCIYQQLDGDCWFDTGRHGEFVISPRALGTSHSDLPYVTAPTGKSGLHLRLLKIPLQRYKPVIERNQDLSAQLLNGNPGLAALLTCYFEAFVAQASHLKGASADASVRTLADLAIVARGLSSPHGPTGQAAIRASRLQAAREIIERDLSISTLSATVMAVRLGISVRQLQLLFEPTGTSYARYVLSRRLERARLLLAQAGSGTVAEIASACGFESLATFHRNFRSAYGMSPSDFRQSANDAENQAD
jgi:AraC-like DNA-binding protein